MLIVFNTLLAGFFAFARRRKSQQQRHCLPGPLLELPWQCGLHEEWDLRPNMAVDACTGDDTTGVSAATTPQPQGSTAADAGKEGNQIHDQIAAGEAASLEAEASRQAQKEDEAAVRKEAVWTEAGAADQDWPEAPRLEQQLQAYVEATATEGPLGRVSVATAAASSFAASAASASTFAASTFAASSAAASTLAASSFTAVASSLAEREAGGAPAWRRATAAPATLAPTPSPPSLSVEASAPDGAAQGAAPEGPSPARGASRPSRTPPLSPLMPALAPPSLAPPTAPAAAAADGSGDPSREQWGIGERDAQLDATAAALATALRRLLAERPTVRGAESYVEEGYRRAMEGRHGEAEAGGRPDQAVLRPPLVYP